MSVLEILRSINKSLWFFGLGMTLIVVFGVARYFDGDNLAYKWGGGIGFVVTFLSMLRAEAGLDLLKSKSESKNK